MSSVIQFETELLARRTVLPTMTGVPGVNLLQVHGGVPTTGGLTETFLLEQQTQSRPHHVGIALSEF